MRTIFRGDRAGDAVGGRTSETVRECHKRWVASRVAKGNTSTRDDKSRYETAADSLIGDKPMALVTRCDVEGIVEALDAKVRANALSHGVERVGRRGQDVPRRVDGEATRLRVGDDNPCERVAPPDRGVRRAKQFLYPSELLALMDCAAIALDWRRLIALAVYLFPHQSWRRGIYSRIAAERARFESARRARVEEASSRVREVTGEHAPTMGADGALNKTPLDRGLDRDRPAPAVVDAVEAAIAKALEGATAAGRFDVVAQLARELEARRLARMGNVVALATKTRQ